MPHCRAHGANRAQLEGVEGRAEGGHHPTNFLEANQLLELRPRDLEALIVPLISLGVFVQVAREGRASRGREHVLEQLAGKRLDRWVLDSWVLDRCLDAAADALVVLTRVVILFSTSLVAVTLALLIHVAASRRHLSFVTQDSFVAIAGLTQDSSQDVRVTMAAARQRRLEH